MGRPVIYTLSFETLDRRQYPVYAQKVVYTAKSKSTPHRHDFAQIWYCYKGRYYHQVEDKVYDCPEGSVILLPMGTAHNFWAEADTQLLNLDIRQDFLDMKAPGQHLNSAINLFLPQFFDELKLSFDYYKVLGQDSRRIWEQMVSWLAMLNYAPSDIATLGEVRDGMEKLFSVPEYAVADKITEKAVRLLQTRVSPILRIINYLNKHYPEKITDEILQQEGNVSRAVMYRYFKRVMNTTYASFLQYLRSRHAHICMRETIYSLTDIAELCGFYDVYHMSRVYAKCTGVTLSKQRDKMEACRKEREGME